MLKMGAAKNLAWGKEYFETSLQTMKVSGGQESKKKVTFVILFWADPQIISVGP